MRRAVLLALLLSGCAATPAEAPAEKHASPAPVAVTAPPIEIPPRLRSCPLPPTAPPAPRTVEQLGAYAIALEENRVECAERLRLVVQMIERTSP